MIAALVKALTVNASPALAAQTVPTTPARPKVGQIRGIWPTFRDDALRRVGRDSERRIVIMVALRCLAYALRCAKRWLGGPVPVV
jgi:hypothetical protein